MLGFVMLRTRTSARLGSDPIMTQGSSQWVVVLGTRYSGLLRSGMRRFTSLVLPQSHRPSKSGAITPTRMERLEATRHPARGSIPHPGANSPACRDATGVFGFRRIQLPEQDSNLRHGG